MSKPKEPNYWMSHDANHFIYFYNKGVEKCSEVSGLQLKTDSIHVKSQLINKLKIESDEYGKILEADRKEMFNETTN